MQIRMKKLLIILACFFMLQTADAQTGGLKLGINTYNITPQDVNFVNNNGDSILMSLADANYGIHGGAFLRIPLTGRLYIEADVLLGSSSMSYTLDSFSTVNGFQQAAQDSKTFLNLTVPLKVGITLFDKLRLNGGVVGSYTLNNQSDLFNSEEYASTWNNMTWGYQVGAGLDISKFTIDASFQGAITQFGNEVMVSGNTYALDSRPRSFVFTLGYKLF